MINRALRRQSIIRTESNLTKDLAMLIIHSSKAITFFDPAGYTYLAINVLFTSMIF
jgi:hypothetical protein